MYTGLHSFSRRQAFQNPGYSVFEFLDEAAAWGFESVEIMTGAAGKPPTHIGSDEPAHLASVCSYAAERNLRIHCFSTYNDFAFVRNEAWRQDNLQYIQHWLRLAGGCGVPNLRLLSGYWAQDQTHEYLGRLVIDGTQLCCALAEQEGVNLAFENHSSIFLYAEDIERLLQTVRSRRLTTCPDPTNGFPVGQGTADEHESMYANLARLAPHATNAHLKIFGVDNGTLTAYDLDRLLRLWVKAGYDGPLHFEFTEEDVDPQTIRQVRKIVASAISRLNAEAHA